MVRTNQGIPETQPLSASRAAIVGRLGGLGNEETLLGRDRLGLCEAIASSNGADQQAASVEQEDRRENEVRRGGSE